MIDVVTLIHAHKIIRRGETVKKLASTAVNAVKSIDRYEEEYSSWDTFDLIMEWTKLDNDPMGAEYGFSEGVKRGVALEAILKSHGYDKKTLKRI